MTRNKIIRVVVILLGVGILIVGAIGFYMFNMPHRDVTSTKSDYQIKASEIVSEYLEDPVKANDKYLDAEGESKILEVTGTIASISTDFNDQKVILLKDENANAGVTCTFTKETMSVVTNLKVGQKVSIKGVIRSGASYDEDLEMYENVILDKCSLINTNQ